MLRITTQTSPAAITFLVEGKLVGQWARELELAWKQAATIEGARARIVDLSETLFIDGEGRRILTNLFREGAFFRTACPMMESIVAEITGRSVKTRKHRKLQTAVWAVVILSVVGVAKAASPEPLRLTLHDAVEMALKQNPQVQIANLNTAVTQENQMVARPALLPQANLAVSDTVMRENLEAFLGMSVPGFPQHSGPFWLFQGGANGSAPLFDLGVDLAREEVTQARDRFQAGVANNTQFL